MSERDTGGGGDAPSQGGSGGDSAGGDLPIDGGGPADPVGDSTRNPPQYEMPNQDRVATAELKIKVAALWKSLARQGRKRKRRSNEVLARKPARENQWKNLTKGEAAERLSSSESQVALAAALAARNQSAAEDTGAASLSSAVSQDSPDAAGSENIERLANEHKGLTSRDIARRLGSDRIRNLEPGRLTNELWPRLHHDTADNSLQQNRTRPFDFSSKEKASTSESIKVRRSGTDEDRRIAHDKTGSKSDAASEVRPTDYQTAMAVRRQLQSTGERGRAEAKSRNDEFHPLIGDARAKRQQDAGRGDQTDSRPRTDTTDEGRLSSLHAKDVPNEEKSLPVLLADIAKSERALLTQWQTAVLIFDNVTRSPSDKEGETQFASAVAKSVEKALLQEILARIIHG